MSFVEGCVYKVFVFFSFLSRLIIINVGNLIQSWWKVYQ